MKKFKYSDVLREFYQIDLPLRAKERIDFHFTGAAHHYHMMKHSELDHRREFHLDTLHQHMSALKMIVFNEGDFSRAKDTSLRSLDQREMWSPSNAQLPHPNMFDSLGPDLSCGPGTPHACDFFLENKRPSVILAKINRNYSH